MASVKFQMQAEIGRKAIEQAASINPNDPSEVGEFFELGGGFLDKLSVEELAFLQRKISVALTEKLGV